MARNGPLLSRHQLLAYVGGQRPLKMSCGEAQQVVGNWLIGRPPIAFESSVILEAAYLRVLLQGPPNPRYAIVARGKNI